MLFYGFFSLVVKSSIYNSALLVNWFAIVKSILEFPEIIEYFKHDVFVLN